MGERGVVSDMAILQQAEWMALKILFQGGGGLLLTVRWSVAQDFLRATRDVLRWKHASDTARLDLPKPLCTWFLIHDQQDPVGAMEMESIIDLPSVIGVGMTNINDEALP